MNNSQRWQQRLCYFKHVKLHQVIIDVEDVLFFLNHHLLFHAWHNNIECELTAKTTCHVNASPIYIC